MVSVPLESIVSSLLEPPASGLKCRGTKNLSEGGLFLCGLLAESGQILTTQYAGSCRVMPENRRNIKDGPEGIFTGPADLDAR